MSVHQIETIDEYYRYLQKTSSEVEALFSDILIGVTNFFRDTDAFKFLEEQIIPKLFSGKNSSDDAIRVWSIGCSTGEEAYSVAILLAEHQDALKKFFRIQVFATDIDSKAIATARSGIYPSSISADVSPERLSRYFSIEPGGDAYRIHKTIRDMLIFSEQNVIKDPPFSKIDLIICRNLLIYMSGELQKKLIPLFHYAINPGGFLFLGSSETVGDFNDIFEILDRKLKIYMRKDDVNCSRYANLGKFFPAVTSPNISAIPPAIKKSNEAKPSLSAITEQTLLKYSPAAVLVNAQGDIFYIHGRTGMFLEPSSGEAGINNILKMAREGLKRDLTTALHKAGTLNECVKYPGLKVKTNGDTTIVNLTICPVATGSSEISEPHLYLVILEQVYFPQQEQIKSEILNNSSESQNSLNISKEPENADTNADIRVARLEQELRAKEEYIQTTNEELETSNEELRSSYEEMQSVNEELQSTNEELETSKEELQSVNEELATVNAELQAKVASLSRSINDMNNLLSGTSIATVFVDHKLNILRFTPTSTRIINLIHSDIGRPVGHIVSNLDGYESLVPDTKAVLDTLVAKEEEVKTKDNRRYMMRIQPYRTLDNVIEGAVITFVDITETKKVQEALRLNEERMRVALKASPVMVFNQDKELCYIWIQNPHPIFSGKQFLGKTDADIISEDDALRIISIKQNVLETKTGARQEVAITIENKTYFFDLTVEPLYNSDGDIEGITCALIDITDLKCKDNIKNT